MQYLRFLAFLSKADWHSLGSVTMPWTHSQTRDFPKCAYQAVDIIRVVEDVNRDAQAFASR